MLHARTRVGLAVATLLFIATCLTAQKVDVACLAKHCLGAVEACMLDKGCRSALACVQRCGSNQTCATACLYSYADSAFDGFMECAVTKYHCLTLDPGPATKCSPPAAVVSPFSLAQLRGRWYIARGHNPLYDCFNCQISDFVLLPSPPGAFMLLEQFDVTTVDRKVRHLQANSTGVVNSTSGFLYMRSVQEGLDHEQVTQVLTVSPEEFALVYYCSVTGSLVAEGALVYSRTPELAPDVSAKVKVAAAAAGFNLDEFCVPVNTNCSGI